MKDSLGEKIDIDNSQTQLTFLITNVSYILCKALPEDTQTDFSIEHNIFQIPSH